MGQQPENESGPRREEWGPGEAAKTAKGFERGYLGIPPAPKQPADLAPRTRGYELFFGDHPHTRRDDNVYARFDDGRVEGFNGHRVQVAIDLRTSNYLKTSGLSGNEIRKGGRCVVSMGLCEPPVPVYEFSFRDVQRALRRAQEVVEALQDHPIQWFREKDRSEVVGRPVWWRDQPAIVSNYFADQGCVVLTPDGVDGFLPPGWSEPGDEHEPDVKVDVLNDGIYWFRGER